MEYIYGDDDNDDDFEEWKNDLPYIATLIPEKQKRNIENLSDNETQIQLENILETTLPGGLVNLSGEKSSFLSGQIQIYNENARDTDTIKTTETENDKSRHSRATGLIGTTQDRALYIVQSEKEYETSLKIDQDNAATVKKGEDLKLKALEIQKARASRVIPEPGVFDEATGVIPIRHPTLGNASRIFPSDATMNIVYDWVGSLSPYPLYFKLCNFVCNCAQPSETVSRNTLSILNVLEIEEGLPFEECQEISCPGFKMDI